MQSIQAQINRLRADEARLINERNQARQETQTMKNQWEQIDRTRLLNMLFLPENQDDVRNASLSQILDKFQREVLTGGGSGQGTDHGGPTGPHGRSQENVPQPHDEVQTIDIFDLQQSILATNPNELINRPVQKVYDDFRTLLRTE